MSTMTFSFNPRKKSVLPDAAASVNTLVVSWKLADEIKLSVVKETFVIPNKSGVAIAIFPFFFAPLRWPYENQLGPLAVRLNKENRPILRS